MYKCANIRNTSVIRYSVTSGCAINCNQRQTNEAKKNGITSHFSILQFVVHFVSGSLDLAVGANRPLALRPIIVAIDIHLCQCIVNVQFHETSVAFGDPTKAYATENRQIDVVVHRHLLLD